ncbi:MAG: c-type cytochrome [Candidatus Eiseniibacteriota bacterium]
MRTLIRLSMVAVCAIALALFVLSSGCGSKQSEPPAPAPGSSATPAADSSSPPPLSAELERGRQVFVENCAMCHGESGSGDGDFGVGLKQKAGVSPANLADRVNLDRLGAAGVRRVIEKGGAHTGKSNMMPAWAELLSKQQIDDVANYVMHLPDLAPGVSSYTQRAYLNTAPGAAEAGGQLFVHHCAACHGTEGRGDGALAAGLKKQHNIQPRNLTDSTYISHKSDRDLFLTITLGGGHMGKSPYMPVWAGYLTPDQVKDLVSFIRVISRTAPQP